MLKKYKWTLILSSIITLLPMVLALFVGGIIPEEIAIHFGLDGVADGFGGATAMFLILPPVLLIFHWLCILLSVKLDKKTFEENGKIMRIVLWLIPAISLVTHGSLLAIASGITENIHVFFVAFIGILFIVIGNYMPKMRKSVTAGIKVKWAYTSDDNWFATHRFAGRVFVAMGFIMLAVMFLPVEYFVGLMLATVIIGCIIPVIYSYKFYKKQLREGTLTVEEAKENIESFAKESFGSQKKAKVILLVSIAVVVAILCIIMFTGKVELSYNDSAVLVDAPFYGNIEINYSDIDSVEYRANGVGGMKVNGFNSAKMLLGTFRNNEFGIYTRYTGGVNSPAIVIRSSDRVIVIGDENPEDTAAIYRKIIVELSK